VPGQPDRNGVNLLTTRAAGVRLRVLSSTRPPVPQILDVVPLIHREGEGDSVIREGGWIRVHLGRPWGVTGDDELLGVVAEEEGQPLRDGALYPVVSLAGQDQLRRSGVCPPLSRSQLSGDQLVDTYQVRLPELVAVQGTAEVAPVPVVGFRPAFDAAGDRWFCDIRVDSDAAYFPFVRLALVRLQPYSITAIESPDGQPFSPELYAVSPVVTADIVQTLPSRTLTVTRAGDLATVTVTGPSYDGMLRRSGAPNRDQIALARLTCVLQERSPAYADELLAWSDVGTNVELLPDGSGAGWRGQIDLQESLRSPLDTARRRLLIREEDRVASDFSMSTTGEFSSRTVYLETVAL
jgi:hypothetical protein